MSAKLSAKAVEWLNASNCFDEVSDDYLSVANSNIVILLSNKAIADLNRQAKESES